LQVPTGAGLVCGAQSQPGCTGAWHQQQHGTPAGGGVLQRLAPLEGAAGQQQGTARCAWVWQQVSGWLVYVLATVAAEGWCHCGAKIFCYH
jgi:hypothetical protein